MFVSTRDQGSTRRSRLYGVNKSARSSKLSILSATSATSTSSTGSAATITQDSYSKSRDHSSRPRRKRRTRDDRSETESAEKSVLEKALGKEKKKRSVDVFDFLVDETARRSGVKTDVDRSPDQTQIDTFIESDPECYYRSHHSDSGISMGSSTGDAQIPDSPSTAPLPTLLEDVSEHVYSSASSVADCSCCQQEAQLHWNQYQGSCYHGDQVPQSPVSYTGFFVPPKSFVQPEPGLPATNETPTTTLTSTPIIFRDKAGSQSTPRVFRRFRKINSRVLIQMQANIAALEHEIKLIDTRDTNPNGLADSPSSKSKSPQKSQSTRNEQARRARIYEELRTSIEQYYQALIATHQVDLVTKIPSTSETQSFQKWIKSHIFDRAKTSTLINDESDLVCFKPPAVRESPFSTFRIIALSALINALMPLLIYKFTNGILNRLIIWSIIIASGAMTLEKFGMKAGKTYTTCIVAFGSISLGAALSL